jgi:hypothetical protein
MMRDTKSPEEIARRHFDAMQDACNASGLDSAAWREACEAMEFNARSALEALYEEEGVDDATE